MDKIICDTIFNTVKAICFLIAIIYLLKFIQPFWLKSLDIYENNKIQADRKNEQLKLFERKIIEEEIRKLERQHYINVKEKEIRLKDQEIAPKGMK